MSSLEARCVFSSGLWEFNFEPESFNELTIHIGFDVQVFNNLSFGYSFGDVVKEWPVEGQTYVKSDQPFVHSERNFLNDGFAVIDFFATNDGVLVAGQFEVVLPRPPQPFESWSYVDGVWVPPVPIPEDASMHWDWDEASLSWVGHVRPEVPVLEVLGE